MSQLFSRRKMIACSANDALALATSFMPNHAASVEATMNGTQMNPAFCSHIGRVTPLTTDICGSPPKAPNPLPGLGKEKADIRHAGGEVPSAETAQQSEDQERRIARFQVSHREAHADRRNQQGGGAGGGPLPAAEDRHP